MRTLIHARRFLIGLLVLAGAVALSVVFVLVTEVLWNHPWGVLCPAGLLFAYLIGCACDR